MNDHADQASRRTAVREHDRVGRPAFVRIMRKVRKPFVEKELRPELLEAPCAPAGIALSLRHQPGYDHSYYFISKFMPDHVLGIRRDCEGDRR
jgi:S-formylglutathione hydrolase FrmB